MKENAQERTRMTDKDRKERKNRLQTHGKASITRSIADAVVVKDGDLFLLTERNGTIPMGREHGLGLYYHDCRFLNGYDMKLNDLSPEELISTATRGFLAIIELTNPDLKKDGKLIQKDTIGINWQRAIDGPNLTLCETITFLNYGHEEVEFLFSLKFRAEFEPMIAVRGMLPVESGKRHESEWENNVLSFLYQGDDKVYRSLSINFSPPPQKRDQTEVSYQIRLRAGENKQINLLFHVAESKNKNDAQARDEQLPNIKNVLHDRQRSLGQHISKQTEFLSNSKSLNRLMNRSLCDLHLLKTKIRGEEFFAAGVPWFVTLFGRDSIITGLQMLAFDPDIAENTLRLLASYQGKRVDAWRDEEPGKIMHELRVGELANLNEIPQTPYYGTVDATLLFLILIAKHADWTGRLELFNDLRGNVEAALNWIDKYGDQNGDGYIEYQSSAEKGLINQGWKDSGDGIVDADGNLAKPPISLVEVQGYCYLAKLSIANLFERVGDTDLADRLRSEADKLKNRFNKDFWIDDKNFFALALESENKPAAVISSNPGQALWTGIVDKDKAKQVVDRLMSDEMFNGWGIRTLSPNERRYNPIGYHLGTVWPHDNSIIAAGFRNYGFDKEACRIFKGIIEAATYFAHDRLPEVFAGFARADYGEPVRYPVACHPQAWAAGSVPFMIGTLLGLQPDAFDHRLKIVTPLLPERVDSIELRRLRVGNAHVDLRFERGKDDTAELKILEVHGQLQVEIEQ